MGAGEGRLGYISMATNNLNELLNDSKGARCVYCFGAPVISLVVGVHVVDESTVLCPLCGRAWYSSKLQLALPLLALILFTRCRPGPAACWPTYFRIRV